MEAGSELTIVSFHSDLKVADTASIDIDLWLAEKETTTEESSLECDLTDYNNGGGWPADCCCLNSGGNEVCTPACNNGMYAYGMHVCVLFLCSYFVM